MGQIRDYYEALYFGWVGGPVKIDIDILNKNGAPERMANNKPQYFWVKCEIDYSIDPGQKQIINPSDICQPGHPACVEEITLRSAKILYGSIEYPLGKDSRWWAILETKILEDEHICDNILQYEYSRQESGSY